MFVPRGALVNDIYARISLMFNTIERDTGYPLSAAIRTGDRNDLGKNDLPNFLITTPESLDVMLSNRYDLIKTVRSIILDDLHELFGTPRGLHLKILVERLKKTCQRDIQCIVMSATIADPRAMADWLFGSSEKRRITVILLGKRPVFALKKAEFRISRALFMRLSSKAAGKY